MIKYIAIFLLLDDEVITNIKQVSNTRVYELYKEGVNCFTFESVMTKDEITTFLTLGKSDRFFILIEVDRASVVAPTEILEKLNIGGVNNAINTEEIVFDIEESIDIFKTTLKPDELKYFNDNFKVSIGDIKQNEIEPRTYVDSIPEEFRAEIIRNIEDKLPNITKWEAEVLILLNE